nr:peroxisomal adenine nucleotide transporter 1 [Quercus suber]
MSDEEEPQIPYNAQLDAFTLYHIVQDTPVRKKSSIGPALPALGHALAGALATAATKSLLYPLDLVITRLQVQRQLRTQNEASSAAQDADAEYKDLGDAARKIYKNEGGMKAFYTGCMADVTKGLADSFLFFLAYTFIRQALLKRQENKKNLSVARELSVGIVAGSFSKFLTTPIQNIVTRQQTAALIAARNPSASPLQSDKLTVTDIARQILSERGWAGFWTGYSAAIILTLNPAITFAVDKFLRKTVPRRHRDTPQTTFLLAAISKVIATSATYPVMLAKSRAQAISPSAEGKGAEKEAAAPSVLSRAMSVFRILQAQKAIFLSLRQIYRTEGLQGLYSGLSAEVLKGFLSHGTTMMVKDQIHIGVIETYYLLLKMTKKWPAELEGAGERVGDMAKDAVENAGDVARDAAENAEDVARDVGERAQNLTETVTEGARQLFVHGKKVMTGDE